ncbi:hypothetical protein RB595_006824 [Gaeumannomyces hyphopodioides]
MQSLSVASLLLAAATGVFGHGRVLTPLAREVGDGFKQNCGEQMFNNVKGDPNGNIQQLAQQAPRQGFDASKCQLELCKGIPFSDNDKADRIQKFSPGQKVDFVVAITAPHSGICNVSVVDTTSNSVIGTPLIEFDNYASTKTGVAKNNTNFSVTMPASLPSKCGTAGACVLQWFWDSPVEAKQTYISCVDFAFSGAGSGATPQPAPSRGNSTTGVGSGSGTAPSPATSSGANSGSRPNNGGSGGNSGSGAKTSGAKSGSGSKSRECSRR